MKIINLGIAFFLELIMLVIYGYFGYRLLPGGAPWPLRYGLTILIPASMAIFWGFFLAPRAGHRLQMPWLLIMKLVIMGAGVGMLWQLQKTTLAVIIAIVIGVHCLLATMWHQV
jgi:hypothetical protein